MTDHRYNQSTNPQIKLKQTAIIASNNISLFKKALVLIQLTSVKHHKRLEIRKDEGKKKSIHNIGKINFSIDQIRLFVHETRIFFIYFKI